MAKFTALSETDIVGSTDSLPFPPSISSVAGSTTAFYTAFSPFTDYYIFNTSPPGFAATATITSFSHLSLPSPFAAGAGQVNQIWKADPGDTYLMGQGGTPSTDTYLGLALTAKVGDLTKTNGTEQQINQFFFKFDDAIHGSDEDDMLCGWAGKDKIWGEEGDDEFYYGQGMGKDKIMDLNKKKDSVILDTDLVKNFNKLVGDVVLKNGKMVLKFSSSEKLVIYGIDNFSDLKKVVAFDDFTDFS